MRRFGTYMPFAPMPYPRQLQWINGELVPAPAVLFVPRQAPPSHMAGPRPARACGSHKRCGCRGRCNCNRRRRLGDPFDPSSFFFTGGDPGVFNNPDPSTITECVVDSDCFSGEICDNSHCVPGGPGPSQQPGGSSSGGNQNSIAALIAALAQGAGRIIAGSKGISPSQFALQNPGVAQSAVAQCQAQYGAGTAAAIQCLQQRGVITQGASGSSSLNLSSTYLGVPLWGWGIGVGLALVALRGGG